MPLSPYQSIVGETDMTPTALEFSLQQMPFDHADPTNSFLKDEEKLTMIRPDYGQPEASSSRSRSPARLHRSTTPTIRRDSPVRHPTMARRLRSPRTRSLVPADPKTPLGHKNRVQGHKTIPKASTSNPLSHPGQFEPDKVADTQLEQSPESNQLLTDAPDTRKAENVSLLQQKALPGDSYVQGKPIVVSPPGHETNQDGFQLSKQKDLNLSQDSHPLSRRLAVPAPSSAGTPSFPDIDTTDGMSRLTSYKSHQITKDGSPTRDRPYTQDESSTRNGPHTQDGLLAIDEPHAQDGLPAGDEPPIGNGPSPGYEHPARHELSTQDGPGDLQVLGLYDEEVPGAADTFGATYSASSDFQLPGVPYTGVIPNVYTNPGASMQSATGSFTLLPSNAYADPQGNIFSMHTAPGVQMLNTYTDGSMLEPTASFDQQNNLGGAGMPEFLPTLPNEGLPLAENQNMLTEERPANEDPGNLFNAGAETLNYDFQTGDILPAEFPYASDIQPNHPFPTFPNPLSYEATPAFPDASALQHQNSFPAFTDQATYDNPSSPFNNLTDQAVGAQLYPQSQLGHRTSFAANARGSMVNFPARSTTPATPLTGNYPRNTQMPPFRTPAVIDWISLNHDRWREEFGWQNNARDYFYPNFVDSLGFQAWFPVGPGHREPVRPYNNWSADYYVNVGMVMNETRRLQASGQFGPIAPVPPMRTAPGALRPASLPQGAMAMQNPGSASVEGQPPYRPACTNAGPGGRTGMGLPPRHSSVATDASATRTPAAGSRGEAGRVAATTAATPAGRAPTTESRRSREVRRVTDTTAVAPTGRFLPAGPPRPAEARRATGDSAVAPADRPLAAGSRRPAEAGRVSDTAAPRSREVKRRGLRPRDSGMISAPISITNWLEENVGVEEIGESSLLSNVAGTALPIIKNPAKKSKAPILRLKLTPQKRREKRPAPASEHDDEAEEMEEMRRKDRAAPPTDRDNSARAPKRSRKSGMSLFEAEAEAQEATRAGSEAGSSADADRESESLTAYFTQG
ncbi:hypothetical protein MMC26_002148 [Xylographa opegraphella]|nr:hypothetical protein [Xylographa opegraphella]